ncbi:MAG: VOC family protein [Burkholderiales bacterium]
MLRSHIDHLVITAPSLDTGVEYVRDALGVSPQAGGQHIRMGTHNCLLKLGDALFLEVISIDPAAPPPARPRWFQLDEEESVKAPRLATWVVRTTDISAAIVASPVVSGYAMPMTRDDLSWTISIPRNGSLPLQGVAPTMIQWQGPHPASRLQESGCSLVRLEGFHARADKVTAMLEAIGFQGTFTVSPLPSGASAKLVAHIQTPAGTRQIPPLSATAL